jgi:hypothetical protein
VVSPGYGMSYGSASAMPHSPGDAQAHPASSGVTGGALFGGSYPLVAAQSKLGRKLAIVRLYYSFGGHFSTPFSRQVMSAGSTVLASLHVPDSHGPSYASIAAGRHDKEILTWLTQAEQAAVTYHLPSVYVSFQDEANGPPNRALGTPAQFVAAWRHVHNLAAKAHLNWQTGGRLHWVLILEHWAYFPVSLRPHWSLRLGMAANYWPGAAYVDIVAADGYNRGGCRIHDGTTRPSLPSQTPGSIFGPVLTWAQNHGGSPVFLAEWASAYYTATQAWQVHYIDQMKSYVLAHPQIAAVSYFDSSGYNVCKFSVNDHPQSLAALAAMGKVVRGTLKRKG